VFANFELVWQHFLKHTEHLPENLKNGGQLSASHRNNQRRIWISRLQNSGEPTCQIKYWETKIMNSIGLEWLKHSETWKRLVHCHTDFQTCSKSIVEPAQTGSIRFATVAYSKNMMNTTDRYLFSIFKPFHIGDFADAKFINFPSNRVRLGM